MLHIFITSVASFPLPTSTLREAQGVKLPLKYYLEKLDWGESLACITILRGPTLPINSAN